MVIGIIGGGQIGWMMIDAIHELGYKAIVLEKSELCPCKMNADKIIIGDYSDINALQKLYDASDLITYEFENINISIFKENAFLLSKIPQGIEQLEIFQNRLKEKNMMIKLGFKTVKFSSLNFKNAANVLKYYPGKYIIKTILNGYDGKGQKMCKNINEGLDFLESNSGNFIVEEFVNFDFEISCIVHSNGRDTISYDPILNIHENGILKESFSPATIDDDLKKKIVDISKSIVKKMNIIGTIVIEFFVINNQILINEIAPRPHNSGHLTIEGYSESQYINHIKAITCSELKKPKLIHKTKLINLLGTEILLQNLGGIKYNYNKSEIIKGRKMGHITYIMD